MVVDTLLAGRVDLFLDALLHLVLPTLALAAATAGQVMRFTRSSMIDVGRRDYVEAARAFGIPERVVLFKYMLKPAIVPTLTILGLEFASLLGNAFVVELVFGLPGIASYGVRAILHKDLNALMGVVMATGLVLRRGEPTGGRRGRAGRPPRAVAARRAMSAVTGEVVIPVTPWVARQRRVNGLAWRRFRRSPTAVAGATIVIVVVLAALLAPWITPYPASAGGVRGLQGPSPATGRGALARHRQRRPRPADPHRVRLQGVVAAGTWCAGALGAVRRGARPVRRVLSGVPSRPS